MRDAAALARKFDDDPIDRGSSYIDVIGSQPKENFDASDISLREYQRRRHYFVEHYKRAIEPNISRVATQRPDWAQRLKAAGSAVLANEPSPERVASLQPMQEWEGVVTSVTRDSFWAKLVDVTAGSEVETEVAEFDLRDIAREDQGQLSEGAIFRWTIGYYNRSNGMRIKASRIVFRRMPAWSKRELSEALERADALVEGIIWE
jgi:hypothetical protein